MARAFHYGGQAVIEGVMIRGQRHVSLAVRSPGGQITVSTNRLTGLYTSRLAGIPLLRGVLVLADALVLGTRALLQSADLALGEEQKSISGPLMWLTLAASLAFSLAFFFLAPLFAVRPIEAYFNSAFLSNIAEGLVRLAFFLLYLSAINLMPDIRRIFAYHGAEHRVINAYEAGAELEPEAVKKYPIAHVRCGTSFLLVVVIIAIIVFAALGDMSLWLRALSRVLLVPVIVALGYEVNRLGAAHEHNPAMRAFLRAGLTLQRLSTREPASDQVEVALAALKGALAADAAQPQPESG